MMTVAERNVLAAKGVTGVRLSARSSATTT